MPAGGPAAIRGRLNGPARSTSAHRRQGRHVGAAGEAQIQPLTGTTEALASTLRRYADAGISHVQLVLDPITVEAIEEFAPVLEELDRTLTRAYNDPATGGAPMAKRHALGIDFGGTKLLAAVVDLEWRGDLYRQEAHFRRVAQNRSWQSSMTRRMPLSHQRI